MITPIFLTGLGCSKDEPCVFCNQEAASSKSFVSTDEEIRHRIETTLRDHLVEPQNLSYPIEVAFYGSTFTSLQFAYQKELLKFTQESFETLTQKSHKGHLKIRISTRPDHIRREELLDLKIRFNLGLVEIGVQSMNDNVLAISKRGHTRKDVKRAVKDLREIGIDVSCHQMIGLPGSTLNDELETAKDIVKLKPKHVRIHPTLILRNTVLENMYREGSYKPLNLMEAVDITEKVLRFYRKAAISIIRIGLHPSELLMESIVAGPWHPSFRELVEGKYLLTEAAKQLTLHKGKSADLHIAPQDETYIRGEKNSNYKWLIDNFELQSLEIVKDPKIERGSLTVKVATTRDIKRLPEQTSAV